MAEDTNQPNKAYILMVDDNPTNLALLGALLEDEGYEDLAAISDPRLVEESVAERVPDLVLLDVRMPHMSGHDVLQMLHQRFGADAMPVIILTAQTDTETRIRALKGGARDFLTKPFDQVEVLHRIRNALEAHALYRERSAKARLFEHQVAERTRELDYLANHDMVTGLINRRMLLGQLQDRAPADMAILYLTLDAVDPIADVLGYSAVDNLMATVGNRLQTVLPRGCIVGHWRCQDFLVIDTRDSGSMAISLVSTLLHHLKTPVQIGTSSVTLHPRIGVMQGAVSSAAEAVRLAGMALPHKGSGELWQFYSSEIEVALQRRFELERLLLDAIGNDELYLEFQPKVDLELGEPIGAEALLRWRNPVLGQVSPVLFIPVAEETGSVVNLGIWVLQQACMALASWREMGLVDENFTVAVNVAARQLEEVTLAMDVQAVLTENGLPGRVLELEVTESGLMSDVATAVRLLRRLTDLGCHIAVDDFGTGYSSLAYLKRLPVSSLKIDQSFVRQMHEDESDRVIARTVIAMAQSLGLSVIAEGIELPDHAALLHSYGCDIGQGYLFSRPLGFDAFTLYLEACAQAAR